MNVINKGFLKMALLPERLYQKLGVDTAHLKAILYTKLLMDDRRPNALQQTRSDKANKPVNRATLGTIFMSALMGLFYLLAFTIGNNATTQLTFYFSFFFFMLAASLISDFTSVLIDVRDNFIILPKPVNDRTVVFARILHIFIHICKVVVPMCLPGAVFVCYRYGIGGGLLFLLMILLVTLFTIFFINALYIIILRVTTPRKFRSIISWVQIIFAIVLYTSYQVLPRMMQGLSNLELNPAQQPYLLLLPPFWFASGWSFLYDWNPSPYLMAGTALSLVVPVASLYVVVRYLAPSFTNKLAMITGSGENDVPVKKEGAVEKATPATSYAHFLARLLTKQGAERVGFLFTWNMSSRSREFRMKVYPSVGYLFVLIVVMLIRSDNLELEAVRSNSTDGRWIVLSVLYFSSLLLTTALTQSKFTDKPKAAWIFYTAPMDKPGLIIRGGVKAILFRFFIPLVLVITVAGLALTGFSILPNILLGFANQLLIASIVVYLGGRLLPFSTLENTGKKSGNFMRIVLMMMLSSLIGVAHFLVYHITVVLLIFTVLSVAATWLLMDSIRNTTWEQLADENSKA